MLVLKFVPYKIANSGKLGRTGSWDVAAEYKLSQR